MRFVRAFGGEYMAAWNEEHGEDVSAEDEPTPPPPPPGQFFRPWGVAVVRGLLVVSELARLQVLTPKGVPLQVLTLGTLASLCANEERVWVTNVSSHQVHALKIS